jgi:uncharacterized membrane protein
VEIEVFLMVIGAALVHASWNALVKADGNRLALIKAMSATQLGVSFALIPFVATPGLESWPYLVASPMLSTGYMLFLNRAYQYGDLSHVYPLARGVAPLIVAAVSVGFLDEQLGFANLIAVVLIALGIASLSFTRGAQDLRDPRPVFYALATGGFISGYTIVDGLGARAAGTPHGYMVWLSIITAVMTIGCVHWLQHGKHQLVSERTRNRGIVSGLLSYGASWLVIWALTLAPMAMVSALRETGIVFAVIIGVVVLKERLNLVRLVSIMLTLIGTTILKISR